MRKNRILVLAIIVGVAVVMLVNYFREKQHTDERRAVFFVIARNLLVYHDSSGHLPVDVKVDHPVGIDVRDNSWRMVVFVMLDGGDYTIPWYSSGWAKPRCGEVAIYNRSGSRASFVNAVRPGGPGAGPEPGREFPKTLRRLIIVESYPDEPTWLESGDLDLVTLLKTSRVSEALQLEKAHRNTFLTIFSDFSCAEIKSTIPAKYVEAWVEGKALSVSESSEAASFVVWSNDALVPPADK